MTVPTASDISVVIPVFGRSVLLRRAVASALAERPREVIVVDDASVPPLTLADLGEGAAEVILVRRTVNGGAAAARNDGIRRARGAWIAFLDSDDEWMPGKLAAQCARIATVAEPPVRLLVSACRIERHGTTTTRIPRRAGDWRDALDPCDVSLGSTGLVHRSVFDAVGGFDERFRRLEDWEWLLRALKVAPLEVSAQAAAIVHVDGHPAPDVVRHTIRLLDAVHGGWIRADSLPSRLRWRSSLMIEHAVAAHRSGRPTIGIAFALASIAFWPFRRLWFWRRACGWLPRIVGRRGWRHCF